MSTADAARDPLSTKAVTIHERLCRVYECPVRYFHDLDPLSELVSSMLSHRTKNADSGRAFRSLRERFADWQAVIDAPTAEVQEAIAGVTWPELKAPRIQAVLRAVKSSRGGLSLEFLRSMPPVDARAWLDALPGVGPKTSAAVLSFSDLRMRALPVDSHHHRVAERLALIPRNTPLDRAHVLLEAQLPTEWLAQEVYDNHQVLMRHGKDCCFYLNPACGRCPVLDLCPTGQRRVGGRGDVAFESRPGHVEREETKPAGKPASRRGKRVKTDLAEPGLFE